MNLPCWVEEDIRGLPADFTGQIALECDRGGVTRVDTKTSRQPPETGEMKRTIGNNVTVSPAFSHGSCLHENDGARLDRLP